MENKVKSSKQKKLFCGIGLNDADYVTRKYETVYDEVKQTKIKRCYWECPFYGVWSHLLKRCYSEKALEKKPSYADCSVCEEWLLFSNFKSWMEQQDWEGKQLDKDLLVQYNRIYSPSTSMFITREVNNFIKTPVITDKMLPIGVQFYKPSSKLVAYGLVGGIRKRLGYVETPMEGHRLWLAAKLEAALVLASRQTDPRVAEALVYRYENYKLPDYLQKEFGL